MATARWKGGLRPSVEEALRHLIDASKAMLSILDTDQLLIVLMDKAVELARAQRGFLMLADDAGELRFRAGWHIEGEELDGAELMSRSVAEDVFRYGRPILSANARGDESLQARQSVLDLELQTIMCVPLRAKDRTLGVLYVDSVEGRAAFDDSGLAVFQAMGDLAAIALENARLYELATTDPKTGLANSALLRARLEDAAMAGGRAGERAVLVMIDLDRFKAVNDNYGHPAGDQVLVEVAQILRRVVRSGDLAARFGGEEFALLLRTPRNEEYGAIAERVRREIEEHRVTLSNGTSLSVTASLGIAELSENGGDIDATIASADRCLYSAKHHGRNRVVHESELLVAG